MNKLTNQSAFDLAATHLLRQDRKSMTLSDKIQICAYRGTNNTSCAIGALIPDEAYNPKYEGHGITHNMQNYPEFAALFDGVDRNLLSALQVVHDYQQPNDWRSELEQVARRFALSPAIIHTV